MNLCNFAGILSDEPVWDKVYFNDSEINAAVFILLVPIPGDKNFDFINCYISGKRAEEVIKNCHKGTPISCSGSLHSFVTFKNLDDKLEDISISKLEDAIKPGTYVLEITSIDIPDNHSDEQLTF